MPDSSLQAHGAAGQSLESAWCHSLAPARPSPLQLKDTPCSDEDNLFYGSDAELQRQLQASLAPLTGLTHLVRSAGSQRTLQALVVALCAALLARCLRVYCRSPSTRWLVAVHWKRSLYSN